MVNLFEFTSWSQGQTMCKKKLIFYIFFSYTKATYRELGYLKVCLFYFL